jgi:hypothetical protein
MGNTLYSRRVDEFYVDRVSAISYSHFWFAPNSYLCSSISCQWRSGLAILPAVARASGGPARTVTLAAGPYIVDVNLYEDPPVTDQSVEVTVIPHESGLRLSGRILMAPGLGTDAVELHTQLSPMGRSNTLLGAVRMPVRGAWQIMIQLDGP